MKHKEITIQQANGLVITQKIGPDHPAYEQGDIAFLARGDVEGKGKIIFRGEEK